MILLKKKRNTSLKHKMLSRKKRKNSKRAQQLRESCNKKGGKT